MPDMYVLSTADEIPTSLLVGFLLSIVIFSGFAVYGFRRNIKKVDKE
jgi:hypothetical protein